MDRKQTILIIDDNSDNLRVAANVLKQLSLNILLANNGLRGIAIAELKKPELIILDIQMPEIDGYETCKRIKGMRETADIPVIIMTANTDELSIEKAYECGAVDYITKPIKSRELIARVKTHLKLAGTIEDLKEANNIRNKFFSIIAHDLRGPISGMNMLYNVVLENYNKHSIEEIWSILHNTRETTAKIHILLENLLGWAKTQTGSIVLNKTKIDLKTLIGDNIYLAKISAENKGIEIIKIGDEEVYVEGDYLMIDTVIRNLVNNAVKFTTKNGKIEVGVHRIDNNIEIYVADNGIGMDEELLSHLFRVDKTQSRPGTDGEKGSGLGLYLCEEFIKLHGSILKVESKVQQGSRFSFILPIYKIERV